MDYNNLDSRLDSQNEAENRETPDMEENGGQAESDTKENECQDTVNIEQNTQEPVGETSHGRLKSVIAALYDYAEIFAISIVTVMIVFSLGLKLCRVDGHSMEKTLRNDELLIAQNFFYTPKQGDIIVFHIVNDTFHRPLVKRVIATEGQLVQINFTDKTIMVDGIVYDDENAYISGGEYEIKFDFNTEYMHSSHGKLYYSVTVPEGMLFVLGDNRNNSTDSRSINLGFIDADCVLGKAVIRLNPFTVFD